MKIILNLLLLGGVITVAAIAPNAVQMFGPLFQRNATRDRYYVKTAIGRLVNRGLIIFKENKRGKKYLAITDKGRRELLKYQLGELVIKKPQHWNGQWQVIVFDIKELRRGDRDCLRLKLTQLGFVRLQNSVWVHPYDCEESIVLLKSYFGFGKDLLYLSVDRIENDKWLRRHFGLAT